MTKKKVPVVVTYYTITELLENRALSPIPLQVIPNYMGAIEGIDEVRQYDGQLQQVTIYFKPGKRI